ncbi:tetratricopeptide repeat-containing diguanylate cyclase [Pseudaquabacterium terrae]|uniref:tetratricopeptide repeat-containing diguanylate cyclase n=1 Tax=Pseudaquabacterium terrae TaxID=2732868 RepID=UPI001FE319D5|nr:GGDEF domain-containing protein [Aquabacterium terrae]
MHADAPTAGRLAEQALALALKNADGPAEAWARLVRGYHRLNFGTLADAADELCRARACFDAQSDRAGHILAVAGFARTLWRGGRYREAIDTVLPLRDEGLRVLRHAQRSVLLNTIAGCYSANGDSERAFAYMYEALRDAGPAHGHGLDAVLHCNLSNELLQLGDFEEALRQVEQGLGRSARMNNPFLRSVLLINRIICLTEMGRAAEALDDVQAVLALAPDESGRGGNAKHFETLAIAALAADDGPLGERLLALAEASPGAGLPDERLERVVAQALLAHQQQRLPHALQALADERTLAADDGVAGLSLRVRCQFFHCASVLHESAGETRQALADLRQWQSLHLQQAQRASRARYQAAALHTELLRLQHRLEENDARRRDTERARAALAEANSRLARRVDEAQALQEALRRQATRDALTGLFNRRHLDDTLPQLLAQARRAAEPLALALIDLDHFKSVNDRFGHDVGDQLLVAFGRLLARSVRAGDIACRYGGEEFCLLLPATGGLAAQRLVDGLLQRWRREAFELDGLTLQGLSFSAGVVDSDGPALEPAALLRAADQALLMAKQLGRNRVLQTALPAAA